MKKIVIVTTILSAFALGAGAQAVPAGLQDAGAAAFRYGLEKAVHPDYQEQVTTEEAEEFIKDVRKFAMTPTGSGERANLRNKIEKRLDAGYLNAIDKYGNTALHWAVVFNNTELVKLLTQYEGLDVEKKNGADMSAMDIAKKNRNRKVIKMLEDYEEAARAQEKK